MDGRHAAVRILDEFQAAFSFGSFSLRQRK